MRKRKTLINSISGLINKIISIVFVFIVRHYFVQCLDYEYLGLEGLFSNVLGMFSLVDLGIGNAISFNLFEPIHNNDDKTINAIMRLYKKLYTLIGVLIFSLSLCFTSFIRNFIKDGSMPAESVKLYFLIYALGVSISYLFSYKRTLIFAMQKNYLVLNVDSITKILLSVSQIYALIVYKNYAFYLLLSIILNLLGNIVISKLLAFQRKGCDTESLDHLPKPFLDKIKKHVKALAVTNISWQGIASTDNIIISSMVGVLDLAKNTNYSTISSCIVGIVSSLLGGVSASIGDLLVEKDDKKIKKYFDRYCFAYLIISSYALLGMYFISKYVISLWVGPKLLFDKNTVLFLSLNIFLILNFQPLVDYQNFAGTFVYYKKYSVFAVLINLLISVSLVKIIGINGVFIGTTVTYSFMIACISGILYKHLFKISVRDYYRRLICGIIPLVFSFFIINIILECLLPIGVLDFLVAFIIVSIIYFVLVIVFLKNIDEFLYFMNLLRDVYKSKIKNIK